MKARRFHLEAIALLPTFSRAFFFNDCAWGGHLQRNSGASITVH
jgi:hypothetical protein